MIQLIARLERESGRWFSSVCDAACGTGALLQRLDDGERRLAGYDISPQMLAEARMRVMRAELAEGDVRKPVPVSGRFDLVTCMYDALNYLHTDVELAAFFRHARNACRDDGALMVDLNDRSMYDERDGEVKHRLIDGVGIRERLIYDPGPPPVATTVFEFPDAVEEHVQRPWDADDVEALLEGSGWRVADTMDVMDADRDEPSGKIVYVAVPG